MVHNLMELFVYAQTEKDWRDLSMIATTLGKHNLAEYTAQRAIKASYETTQPQHSSCTII